MRNCIIITKTGIQCTNPKYLDLRYCKLHSKTKTEYSFDIYNPVYNIIYPSLVRIKRKEKFFNLAPPSLKVLSQKLNGKAQRQIRAIYSPLTIFSSFFMFSSSAGAELRDRALSNSPRAFSADSSFS